MTATAGTTVAVLGLGRIGRAVSARLADMTEIRTWNRGVGIPLRETVGDAAAIFLTLFDAAACRDVVGELDGGLTRNTIVVNMTTVAPDEAEDLRDLVTSVGGTYVHAPVLGSTPAVLNGQLTILLGTETLPDHAATLLRHLGEVVWCGSPRSAAALKLLANSALASTLLTIQQSLVLGERLDLDRAAVLDVLAATAFGGLGLVQRRVTPDLWC